MNEHHSIYDLKNLKAEEWEIMITDKWDVKDVLAHLVGWIEEVIKVLPEAWEEKKMPWFMNTHDYSEFNDKAVKKCKDLSPQELLEKYEELEKELNKLVEKIGKEKIDNDKRFGWAIDNSHELAHFREIDKRVNSRFV